MDSQPTTSTDEQLALLVTAAREVGLELPEVSSVADFRSACLAELEHIRGGQDHAHAWNGLRTALEEARLGHPEFVRAGLWEARKVLELVHRAPVHPR